MLVLASHLVVKIFRAETRLTSEFLLVPRTFGVRSIPWRAVRSLDVRRRAWGRSVRVVLESGKTVTLPAPGDWWPFTDVNFEDNLETLRAWSVGHRAQ
jgi:hypothetical protein